jgi:hypothetical protein
MVGIRMNGAAVENGMFEIIPKLALLLGDAIICSPRLFFPPLIVEKKQTFWSSFV